MFINRLLCQIPLYPKMVKAGVLSKVLGVSHERTLNKFNSFVFPIISY